MVRNVEVLLDEHGDLSILEDFQASWAVVRASALLLRRRWEIAENRALTAALEAMCRAAPLSTVLHTNRQLDAYWYHSQEVPPYQAWEADSKPASFCGYERD